MEKSELLKLSKIIETTLNASCKIINDNIIASFKKKGYSFEVLTENEKHGNFTTENVIARLKKLSKTN